jgi:hypothetical protein
VLRSGTVLLTVSGLMRKFPQKTEHTPLDSNPRPPIPTD